MRQEKEEAVRLRTTAWGYACAADDAVRFERGAGFFTRAGLRAAPAAGTAPPPVRQTGGALSLIAWLGQLIGQAVLAGFPGASPQGPPRPVGRPVAGRAEKPGPGGAGPDAKRGG